jgi:ABC-type uncharacterized transport system substrate-binding protein
MTPKVLWLFAASVLMLALSACTHVQSVRAPQPERPHPQPAERPYKDAVAIVLSSNAPAYLSVANALTERLDRDSLRYSLDNADAAVIREIIQREEHRKVIAIGHAAARAVQAIGPERVIYCQVFYDADLQRRGFRGVAAVPTFAMQLGHWMHLEPDLQRIGVVVGANSRQLVEQLKASAEGYGLELHHEEVTSDKQALFVYQRLIPDIDGFVFLPDTTILSPSVIRRMMRYGVKHDTSMLVYSPMMFELGGSILVTPEPTDVAEQILALLDPVQRLTTQRRTLTDAAISARARDNQRVTLVATRVENTP